MHCEHCQYIVTELIESKMAFNEFSYNGNAWNMHVCVDKPIARPYANVHLAPECPDR